MSLSCTVWDIARYGSEIVLFGWPFAKRFAQCYRSIVCLSVTLVYCGQTVGWIKMKLGTEVDLGLDHIVLDVDPAPSPKKGRGSSTPTPQFLAHVLWPNGWMYQDATWYGGRPRPRRHCIRWGPSSPLIPGPCLLWPNGRPFQLLLSSCILPHLHLVPKLWVNHTATFEFRQDVRQQKTRITVLCCLCEGV